MGFKIVPKELETPQDLIPGPPDPGERSNPICDSNFVIFSPIARGTQIKLSIYCGA